MQRGLKCEIIFKRALSPNMPGQVALENRTMDIRVECYSGYRVEETPRRIWFAARTVDVRKVLDRWLSPDHRYFKVLGDDNAVYIIRYDETEHRWQLHYFDQQD